MQPGHALLALGMLITGTLNTLTNNAAIIQNAEGSMAPSTIWGNLNKETELVHTFDHPYCITLGMYLGESLCLLAYLATRKVAARDPNIAVPGGRTKGAFWFAIPALCDLGGTGIGYAGLCLSYPSVFQMLRACSIVFTCIISCVFLKRKIYGFQWFSVFLIVVGVLIVGLVSVGSAQDTAKSTVSVLIGDLLIVFSQLLTATQMCLEEKIMNSYPSAALKVVGLEGVFGTLICGIALLLMYFIRIDGYPIENAPDALTQISNNYGILLAIIGNALSIAFFNFFGISVTQQLSAAHRMVIDSVRTIAVWAVSLIIGWEKLGPLSAIQLLGFAFLSSGTAAFNEIFKIPLFAYPGAAALIAEEDGRQQTSNVSLVDAILKEESDSRTASFVRT